MKIRSGFVSNSSTSSFIIFGTHFKNANEIKENMLPEKLQALIVEEQVEEEDVNDLIRKMCCSYYGDDSLVFGISVGSVDYIEEIASIEELNEYHKETVELFNEYFGPNHKFKIMLYGIKAEM